MGYHAWAGHTGATRVTSAEGCCWTFVRTLPMRFHGGFAYAIIPDQSYSKASVARPRGSGCQLKNSGSWVDNREANRSMSNFLPLWIFLNILGFSCQSDRSLITRDSISATMFSRPGRCCAFSVMLRFRHHIQRSFINSVAW